MSQMSKVAYFGEMVNFGGTTIPRYLSKLKILSMAKDQFGY
jgi:hypothetical protein